MDAAVAEVASGPAVNEFFDGSNLLEPLSQFSGLSIDKVNFLICQLVALLLGFPFRTALGPHRVSPSTRHFVQILVGLSLAVFCFGSQVKHLLIQSVVCLVLMRTLRPGLMEKGVVVFAMGYLCVCHVYRMYYDYGGYTLDITGPLMISTQRLTSLAYNIVDGKARLRDPNIKQSPIVQKLSIQSVPSLLEFSSYTWSFNGLLCGPFCFYRDYAAFIEGTNFRSPSIKANGAEGDGKASPQDPSSFVVRKMVEMLICCGISMGIAPYFSCSYVMDAEFRTRNILYRVWYIYLCTSLQRHKYYFAWKLAEAINANAGLGFCYDANGQVNWDLLENANIYQVELSTSLKVLLDNWNKMTTQWLRLIVYERYNNSMLVFLFSASWHGFYAGYYLTFLFGGLFIYVARTGRRVVRPWFQTSSTKARLYDLITYATTRITLGYLTFPFVLLEFWPSVYVYWDMYFFWHLVALGFFVLISLKPGGKSTERSTKQS